MAVNTVLIILWVAVIMRFSGENADISGPRSSGIIIGIINAVAPSANVTAENYKSIGYLYTAEKVVRKLAHMTEYGILTFFIFSLRFIEREFIISSQSLAIPCPPL